MPKAVLKRFRPGRLANKTTTTNSRNHHRWPVLIKPKGPMTAISHPWATWFGANSYAGDIDVSVRMFTFIQMFPPIDRDLIPHPAGMTSTRWVLVPGPREPGQLPQLPQTWDPVEAGNFTDRNAINLPSPNNRDLWVIHQRNVKNWGIIVYKSFTYATYDVWSTNFGKLMLMIWLKIRLSWDMTYVFFCNWHIHTHTDVHTYIHYIT
jgi:hypothetical protein